MRIEKKKSSSLITRGREKFNLDPIATFHSHLSQLYILLRGISVLDSAKNSHQPYEHVDCLCQDLLLRRAYPWATKKRHKLPHRSSINPSLGSEFIDIITPDVSVVVKSPKMESHHSALFNENGGLTVGTATYGKDRVANCDAKHTPGRPLQTDRFKQDVLEEYQSNISGCVPSERAALLRSVQTLGFLAK